MSEMAMPTTEKKQVESCSDNWVCPEFKVSGVFSSHMVLQREKPIKIWGFSSTPGSKVFGEFSGEGASCTVGEDLKWTLVFSARLENCEPQSMKIWDDKGHEVLFDDILIGDVWLIGGQSNAELTLNPCMKLTPSIDFYDGDNFRLFTQTQAFVYTHQDFCLNPQRDIINPEWTWKRPDEAASLEFSAMGYYFAREMIKSIGTPLGMIMMCAGGACIRELLPEELAHKIGYNYGANVRESGYYNTLIYPFIPLSFKAMIYFQGESEAIVREQSDRYCFELALLVEDERRSFGFEFPFYNVQLSTYPREGLDIFKFTDIVRAQEFDAMKVINNSTLTVDMDLGAPDDWEDWPHSPRKLELGERLARLALAREYGIGREDENSSPMPISAILSKNKKAITVEFKNIASGLTASGQTPVDSIGAEVAGFTVGDYEHKVNATAVIASRNTVVVTVPAKTKPTHVGYAFTNLITPENATLRNGVNLPCPTFLIKL